MTDTVDGVGSEDFLRELQAQSVHSKKKKRHDSRQEERDFFLPLLERMNSSDNPRISDLDISPTSELPSLTEICLSVVLQNSLSGQARSPPFVKHLKSRFKGVDVDTSGRLLKWGWSALNQYEELDMAKQHNRPWHLNGPTVFTWQKELFNIFCSYLYSNMGSRLYVGIFTIHVPFLPVTVLGSPWYYSLVPQRALLHLVNHLFAHCCHDLNRPNEKMISKTVSTINRALEKNCPKMMKDYNTFCHLWPAYVCWSRGWIEVAADMFAKAYTLIKDSRTKLLVYGELARMFTHFGDRRAALKFMSHITDHYQEYCDLNVFHLFHQYEDQSLPLVALQAAVWDTGIMNSTSSANAGMLWHRVSTATSVDTPLLVAAVESALSIHTLQASGCYGKVHTPEGDRGPLQEWSDEVERLLNTAIRTDHRFGYYLTFLYSMLGNIRAAQTAWSDYKNPVRLSNDRFSCWCEVEETFRSEETSPWLKLAQTITGSSLWKSPFLRLVWRTRLQWPVYPLKPCRYQVLLSDHCCQNVNLRLTDSGYITADIAVDFPPMTCVLFDPLTGALTHNREDHLKHCYHSSFSLFGEWPDEGTDLVVPPHPIQLVAFGDVVVEYTAAHIWELTEDESAKTLHSSLTWYHSSGRHKTLDVLSIAKEHFKGTKRPNLWKRIDLLSYFIFGKHTLALLFTCLSYPELGKPALERQGCDFLMFIQFHDEKSFAQPSCYVARGYCGFCLCSPNSVDVQAYPQRWLPHCKLFTVLYSTGKDEEFQQLVFDDSGRIVHKCQFSVLAQPRGVGNSVSAVSRQGCLRIRTSFERRLYKVHQGLTCETLDGEVSTLVPEDQESINFATTVPGILVLVSKRKVSFWDPSTNSPYHLTATFGEDEKESLSFEKDVVHLKVLRVWNVLQQEEGVYGCMAALGINDTLVVLQKKLSSQKLVCSLNVSLPGYVYEYCTLGKKGHIVVTSMVKECCREEMYWLNTEGRLLGVIPSLGCGPHYFLPLFQEKDGQLVQAYSETVGDVLLYYTDGHGAVCCARLDK
jgi:hypothetical protein